MRWTRIVSFQMVPSLLMFYALGCAANTYYLTDMGQGHVSMKGSIVETPCSIDVGDRNQSLKMDTLSIYEFIRDGQGPLKEFDIHLINCVVSRMNPEQSEKKTFQLMFEGEVDQGFFGVNGEARGVALAIRDASGQMLTPGNALSVAHVSRGNHSLRYSLNLVGNKKRLQAGDYRSSIRFRMDYY